MSKSFPHQRRFFAALPDVDRDVLVRVNRYIDGVMAPTERSSLSAVWRPIADHVCERVVLIEHFSGSMSHAEYQSALTKLHVYATKHWSMVRGDRPTRAPTLVIVTHKAVGEILDSLEPTETLGIYRSSRRVEHIVVVATKLPPDDATLTPLRLCTRVPDDEATEVEFVQYLRADKHLSTLEKERLMEQIMANAQANFSETFQEMCERFVREMQTEPRYQTMMAEMAELKARHRQAEARHQQAEARLEEERARYEQVIADLRRRLADDSEDG